MNNAIYEGHVRHTRYSPRPHHFRYHTAMLYLNLDNIQPLQSVSPFFSINRNNIGAVCERDLLGGTERTAGAELRDRWAGRDVQSCYVLTLPRSFGLCFNPVSFYYGYDRLGGLRATMAEITNTPYGERHCYDLSVDPAQRLQHSSFAKDFFVSPFIGPNRDYEWLFTRPGAGLSWKMKVWKDKELEFDAQLALRRVALTRKSLHRMLALYSFPAVRTVAAIYWQALRLVGKRAPIYDHI